MDMMMHHPYPQRRRTADASGSWDAGHSFGCVRETGLNAAESYSAASDSGGPS
ncbi:hypothetical protein MINTM019_20720 [Mycobacterium paraintracellulare]|nr:hypothetical protein MINTM019_20720 [Mycobacterium paraintracellulare]